MAQAIVLADPQSLVPPLLACLPTAFASSKPPPAFLPLLSPILQQRLQIHTSTGSVHESWIRLLCWDPSKAETLKETIENANFEPHPASGELEVGETDRISYKSFDAETLKAQIPLNDWSLTALYLWCPGGEEGNSWKLAELLPYDSDLSQDASWSSSPAEAMDSLAVGPTNLAVQQPRPNGRKLSVPGYADEDDDDYWDQYDKTPGRTPSHGTPARKRSVNPNGSHSDADHYARYGDVQPAMDNYDPDEHHDELGDSTLHGDNVQRMISGDERVEQQECQRQVLTDSDVGGHDLQADAESIHIDQPAPASPSSGAGSDLVSKLESTADRYSASEIAIKQHISYSVKSIYRLAKGAGMSRQDFEDMVQRELDTLSMLDRED